MSDTPLTDAQLVRVYGKTGAVCAATPMSGHPTYVPAEFARAQELELNVSREALFQVQEAAKHMTNQFDVLRHDLVLLQAVARAAAQLCDNAEEYDCDGLGLFAQHGWWEPLHEALDALNESETRRDPQSEIRDPG